CPPCQFINNSWGYAFLKVKLEPVILQHELPLLRTIRDLDEKIYAVLGVVITRIELFEIFSKFKLGANLAGASQFADERNLRKPMPALPLHRRGFVDVISRRKQLCAVDLVAIMKQRRFKSGRILV